MIEVRAPHRAGSKGPTSHSFVSQRLKLHYHDYGNSDAPTLILLHGKRDHGRSWDWLAGGLVADWHVIAPDLRGHGESAWASDGNYDLLDFTYDLAQLVHQLDKPTVQIVAHSLGGQIALRFASLFPEAVARLAIIEGAFDAPQKPIAGNPDEVAQRLGEWMTDKRSAAGRFPRRYASLEDVRRRVAAENPNLSEAQVAHLARSGVNRNEDGTYSWKFDNHLRISNPIDAFWGLGRGLWSRITCPVLLCHGTESWLPSPFEDDSLDCFAQRPEVVLFEGAGHWLHHDQTERCLAAIRPFLA
ncbi:MAG: alpha/beta hydrolase [Bradyrhizobium sp.]|nr:alpha/beta hydrolase [Bradyrhizobium sp.]